jgi:regulator of sigma E protease
MQELFSFLVVIGIIIFIHESGHFSMAKLFGIPVATFSLGFGPRLFGFRYKETEYKVSAIPLGGYVKIHGMEDQEATPDDPNSFYNRPRYQRFLVLFMGVGFNMLLALLLISIALNRGIQVSQSIDMPSKIGSVEPGSPAEKAGLKPGDVILEMNGEPTPTWEKVSFTTLLNPKETMAIRYQRGDQTLESVVHVSRKESTSLGYIGVTPATTVIVLSVTPDMPAGKAGLKENDVIKEINGIPIQSVEMTPRAVQKSEGGTAKVVVLRTENGKQVQKEFEITPIKDKANNRWILGFAPGEPTKLKKLPFLMALKESFRTCKQHVQLNAIFLSKLFQGKLSLKATSGPFDIARLSQATRKTGLSTFLLFIGTISFDIGIINLLPIPALDGGHLFFLILEGIFRREFSIKLKERMTMIGFVFLICVMVVVLYYDLLKTGPVQKLLESISNH